MSFSEIGDAYYDSRLLGHASLASTARYTRVATKTISNTPSRRWRWRISSAAMANHASTRTTQLYDRRRDEVSLDEVERIAI